MRGREIAGGEESHARTRLRPNCSVRSTGQERQFRKRKPILHNAYPTHSGDRAYRVELKNCTTSALNCRWNVARSKPSGSLQSSPGPSSPHGIRNEKCTARGTACISALGPNSRARCPAFDARGTVSSAVPAQSCTGIVTRDSPAGSKAKPSPGAARTAARIRLSEGQVVGARSLYCCGNVVLQMNSGREAHSVQMRLRSGVPPIAIRPVVAPAEKPKIPILRGSTC